MGNWDWLSQNIFNIFGSAGIAGLWITIFTLRDETKARRSGNLLTITENHREIWCEYLNNPELHRIRSKSVDTSAQPITEAERVFVGLIILHSSSVHYAMRDQVVVRLEGMRRDLAQFLSLPIPEAIWKEIKPLQNEDFVKFVDECLSLLSTTKNWICRN